MQQFFSSLLQQIRNYRDPGGNAPQPDDIVHLYMDNAGVGFTFSMDYADRQDDLRRFATTQFYGAFQNGGEFCCDYSVWLTCDFEQQYYLSHLGVCPTCWCR